MKNAAGLESQLKPLLASVRALQEVAGLEIRNTAVNKWLAFIFSNEFLRKSDFYSNSSQ